MSETRVRIANAPEAKDWIPALADVLLDCVAGGASVSFMASLTRGEAEAFWTSVAEGVAAGERRLLVATLDGAVVGTVQVVFAPQPNQPHRADVAKLLVRRDARRMGLAADLVRAAEAAALEAGKTVLVLDTVTGGDAERLYARLGWVRVGVIPDYALFPDGSLCDTTVFYKALGGGRA